MRKNLIITTALILYGTDLTNAQVAINNTSPKATLDITAKNATGTTNPNIKDGILIPTLDRARAQAIGNNSSPAVTESTLIYVSNTTTGTNTGSAINILVPGFYYFDSNTLPAPGVWQAIRPSNVDLFGFQVKIPPHNQYVSDFSNHSNTSYDNDNWWVISKSSSNAVTNQPARMTIVYEYQGTPLNLTNLYPQFTAGNNSGFPDVYVINIVSILNNGTGGKTRLTVSIARSDNFNSNWQGTFFINSLFVRKIN
ncbi:hypothetical protein CRN76_10470 [Chryseobacterium indologenes]|uniref:hypothetical protein n=1 Tax=Chryseobacterium indologenes TaxID=253 RepID=UPI000B5167A9|nr:hypothetical protein [Chryseobacterium indologenes]ASE61849.1 hypothetical protein CEQ15_10315 [Chryseobacterium indologenes]ATN05787.1 hypothetical protein CRN76_10470 [Chryseobacterium indologenes]AYY85455.1 hypothetical protein EGX91_13275 [Chryseobacterium indologenes]QIX82351.1 hypothetical protein FOB56_14350 [Chryseobacterium indologenes]UDQ51986.1 hypothetical protein LJF28_11125 [Chryseobacterium indologenes]